MTARDVIAEKLAQRYFLAEAKQIADDAMSALLSAPDSDRQELVALLNPWRPIETAPRDGTYVLVCRMKEDRPHRIVGIDRWDKGSNAWWHSRQCEEGQPTQWKLTPPPYLPAPPSEDKT
jgi:hypothetical protein